MNLEDADKLSSIFLSISKSRFEFVTNESCHEHLPIPQVTPELRFTGKAKLAPAVETNQRDEALEFLARLGGLKLEQKTIVGDYRPLKKERSIL